jgi:hypothetical protein
VRLHAETVRESCLAYCRNNKQSSKVKCYKQKVGHGIFHLS